jgi:beta-lactamase class D
MSFSWMRLCLVTGVTACSADARNDTANAAIDSAGAAVQIVESEITDAQAGDLLAEFDATFVVSTAGSIQRYNPHRAEQQFVPASTFKIVNSLIALETGVAPDAQFTLSSDSTLAPALAWWPETWLTDQTLESAFRHSAFWYYQEIARRIGERRMREHLERLDYGNADISGGIDQFWLRGGLRISANEQVAFLEKLYDGKLGVSQRSADIVRSLMQLELTPEYRLSGKTGTAPIDETRELGWLVGYVETSEGVHFYALNMEGDRVMEQWPPDRRRELVVALLRRVQIIRDDD